MSFHATSPAGFPHQSWCPVEQVNESLQTGNADGKLRPSYRGHASRIELRWRQTSAANLQIKTLLPRVCRCVSRLLLGHSFGALAAPGGTRSSASHSASLWGLGSSPDKFESHGKERRTNFFRAPPRKQTFGTWEPGPLATLRPV